MRYPESMPSLNVHKAIVLLLQLPFSQPTHSINFLQQFLTTATTAIATPDAA